MTCQNFLHDLVLALDSTARRLEADDNPEHAEWAAHLYRDARDLWLVAESWKPAGQPSRTCRWCGRVTHSIDDIREVWCGCCGGSMLPREGCTHRPVEALQDAPW